MAKYDNTGPCKTCGNPTWEIDGIPVRFLEALGIHSDDAR